MLHPKADALYIDALNRAPLLLTWFMGWLARAYYPSIVDENIQPLEARCRLADTAFDHRLVRKSQTQNAAIIPRSRSSSTSHSPSRSI